MSLDAAVDVAGVDGCKAGWIAAVQRRGAQPVVEIHAGLGDLLATLSAEARVAIDMPIGLPDTTGTQGRGPERLVRRVLGQRQSSVFSIPSRAAVYAVTRGFTSVEAWYEDHRLASAVARRTSDPPRGVSIQAFGIFGKIREIDELLRRSDNLRGRVFESHPEVAFWRLNGERPMGTPKKIRGVVNPAGMEERRGLLARCGLDRALLDRPAPRGAAADDMLDALAMLLVAARHARGEARPFPDPPLCDGHGLEIAIWA
jgi:predicted RNase H-like nuclease